MKKLNEGDDWENGWAEAFERASLQPSDNVWNAIDGNLANKELRKYKKRAAFYQWVAAASVLLSVFGGAWLFSQSANQNMNPGIAAKEEQIQPGIQNQETAVLTEEEQIPEQGQDIAANAQKKTSLAEEAGYSARAESKQPAAGSENAFAEEKNTREVRSSESTFASADSRQNSPAEAEGSLPAERFSRKMAGNPFSSFLKAVAGNAAEGKAAAGESEAGIALAEKAAFIPFSLDASPVKASIQGVWVASQLFKQDKESEPAKFWLGATLASNSFKPHFENPSLGLESLANADLAPKKGSQVSTARVSQWDEESEHQLSINGGVQAAARIGKKWVLQGGVQYGSYQAPVMGAGAFVDPQTAQAYPLHYANFSDDKIQTAQAGSRLMAPVSVENSFEFISVPLQLGYMVFDRQFSLLLSPGISSEIFLRNQISDTNNRLSSYTIYSGEEAPFSTLHLKGMLSAQLFYKLGDNYMISLEPSVQQALTRFNKSGSTFESKPSTIGLAAGFRYLIR